MWMSACRCSGRGVVRALCNEGIASRHGVHQLVELPLSAWRGRRCKECASVNRAWYGGFLSTSTVS